MTISWPIGLGAGLATALVVAAVAARVPLAVPLFLLLPLPLLIVALGWGPRTGAVVVGVATAALSLGIGWPWGLSYLLTHGGPILVLAALACLPVRAPRQAGGDQTGSVGPAYSSHPGLVLAMIALVSGGFAAAAMLTLGAGPEGYQPLIREELRGMLDSYFNPQVKADLGEEGFEKLLQEVLALVPTMLALVWFALMAACLWIAGRVLAASGRLPARWPDLGATDAPGFLPLTFMAAVAGTFLAGTAGDIAKGFVAAHVAAYVLIGLAVLHSITRGSAFRLFALAGAYLALVAMPPLAGLLLVVLGLADPIFGLRARAMSSGREWDSKGG
ncbi:MAG: hypothetical protein R3D33_03060 [Hyphomicrobiaceae bacterium]